MVTRIGNKNLWRNLSDSGDIWNIAKDLSITLYNTLVLIILMYPCTSWYYQLHIWSKNNILMPSTTNHSYVKYKSIYSIHKDGKLHKKVAYPLCLIAGMQLLSLYFVHNYNTCSILLEYAFIYAIYFLLSLL